MNDPKYKDGQTVFDKNPYFKAETLVVKGLRVKYEYLVEQRSGVRTWQEEGRLVDKVEDIERRDSVKLTASEG